MSHLIFFSFWHFPTIFGLSKLASLATLFDSIGHLLGIFNEVLFTRRSLAVLDETFSVIFKHRDQNWNLKNCQDFLFTLDFILQQTRKI